MILVIERAHSFLFPLAASPPRIRRDTTTDSMTRVTSRLSRARPRAPIDR